MDRFHLILQYTGGVTLDNIQQTVLLARPITIIRLLAVALAKADMIAETAPILSVNLRSKAGRIPKKARNDHHHHASLNIVAHKRSEYVCNSKFVVRTRRSFVAEVGARLSDLDDIGVVVSATHPPKSTFLAPAVAEY